MAITQSVFRSGFFCPPFLPAALTASPNTSARPLVVPYRRRIVISLEPGDVIGMRLERTRTTYRAPLASVFRTLADWHARAEARAKREARKLKRLNH